MSVHKRMAPGAQKTQGPFFAVCLQRRAFTDPNCLTLSFDPKSRRRPGTLWTAKGAARDPTVEQIGSMCEPREPKLHPREPQGPPRDAPDCHSAPGICRVNKNLMMGRPGSAPGNPEDSPLTHRGPPWDPPEILLGLHRHLWLKDITTIGVPNEPQEPSICTRAQQ